MTWRKGSDNLFGLSKALRVAAVAGSLFLLGSCSTQDAAPIVATTAGKATSNRLAPKDAPCVKRVRADAEGAQDGLGWDTAFDSIGKAVTAAQADAARLGNSAPCEVWVAKGTNYVFEVSRMDTLQLAENVHLYGGFKGDESTRAQRDFRKWKTIIDGRDSRADNDRVYHVVTGANDAVLDGFTITHGEAKRSRHGGAIYNDRVSPLVQNCVFADNSAGWFGGAIFNHLNFARISDCVFERNTARLGGAIMNQQTAGQISGVVFRNNEASEQGGAIYNHSRVTTRIVNSVFYRNEAKETGGAVYNIFRADSAFINCAFLGNKAKKNKGGAVYNEFNSAPFIVNSILWDNGKKPADGEDMKISCSIVEHGFPGRGNTAADPLIAERKDGIYALKPGSPCIDAADGSQAPPVDLNRTERVDLAAVGDECCCEPDTESCEEELRVDHADIGAVEFVPGPQNLEGEAELKDEDAD